jgi:hypothetical protein
MDERKDTGVAEFLTVSFPGWSVSIPEDSYSAAQFYRIDDDGGILRHRVLVSREFLDGHTAYGIKTILLDLDVAGIIRRAGVRRVRITTSGTVVETQE